jgi:VWFA-related protein
MNPWHESVVNCRKRSRNNFVWRIGCFFVVVSLLAAGAARAQSASNEPDKPSAAATAADVPELTTHEEIQTFQVKVNLVEVRAVVRDAQGNAVGNLKQEDFLLFDDNKPQTITKFSVEKRDVRGAALTPAQTPDAGSSGHVLPAGPTEHRVLFLVDDINASANELVGARNAIEPRVNSLKPGETVAIITLSGQGNQDFTSDTQRLRAALSQLKSRPIGGPGVGDCPPIDYYIAAQIDQYHNDRAFQMVMEEVNACQFDGKATSSAILQAATYAAVGRVMQAGGARMQLTLQGINEAILRITTALGQRTIVFMSAGIYVGEQQAALTDYLNRAIRAGIVINTLDIKGLYVPSANGVDISLRASGSTVYPAEMNTYRAASDLAQTDSMMQIANATGGTFFHNRNDLAAGVEKLTAVPEYSYLLAFKPQDLKSDGKFHKLRVQLKQGAGLTVQARNGYVAPRPSDSKQDAQREVEEEVFAQNEMHELPLRVQAQFYRSGDDKAHINVLIHVDVQHMAFRKADGRNLNDLTVVAALFDRNANFISAKSQTVQMHIKDETLSNKLSSGITLKSNFDVTPGTYVVRVVARDGQGKLAAQNGVVDIP